MEIKVKDLYAAIRGMRSPSAWSEGVKNYAVHILDEAYGGYVSEVETDKLHEDLLNGASDWKEYSYGGFALISDDDIAEALCTPSVLARTKNGRLALNGCESWLDVQARALHQAEGLILSAAAHLAEEGRKAV